MKPIKLHMSYFGPFEDETIDFSKVQDQMFLISGKTGSGKTMIFDAITFALYGEVSTTDRNEHSVRSQFATDDDVSRVVFTFSVREYEYTIERELSYQKTGRKHKVPSKVQLRNGDGSVLGSKTEAVKEKIIEIIQLSVNQFRQILILPQGEFKRLLLSSNQEKQSILRTLFQTERFVHFQESLVSEVKDSQQSLNLLESDINARFQSIITDDALDEIPGMSEKLSAIQKRITVSKEEKAQLVKEEGKVKENVSRLENELKQQETHNNQLSELHQIDEKMKVLHSKKEKVGALEAQLKQYHLASEIQFELKKEQEIIDEEREKKTEEAELKRSITQKSEEIKYRESILRTLQDKQDEMKQREKWLTQTERFLDEKYKDLHVKEAHNKTAIKEAKNNLAEYTETMTKYKADIEQSTVTQEEIDQYKEQLFSLEQEVSRASEEIEREEAYIKTDQAIESLMQREAQLQSTLKETEHERESLEISLKDKYLNEDKVYIEHLLEHLKVGSACPVCQQVVEKIPETVSYLSENEAHHIKLLEEKSENIESDIEDTKKELYAERKRLEGNSRINLQEKRTELKQLKEKKREISETLANKKAALENLNNKKEKVYQLGEEIHSAELKLRSEETRLDEITRMKKDFIHATTFQDYASFVTAFQEAQEMLKSYNEEFETVTREVETLKNEAVKVEERLKLVKERLDELGNASTYYKDKVDLFLNNHNFQSRETLHTVLQLEDHKEIEQEIQKYYEDEKLLRAQEAQLKNQLKSLEMYDLNIVTAELENEKDRQQTIADQRATVQNTIQHNTHIYNKVSEQVAQFDKEQHQLNALSKLADTVSGKNQAGISLESYVLTYYLDRILSLANTRLLEMTHHRYALVRSSSKGRGKIYAGLDIEVFDYYNNNRRNITSLSGGETFQASLTLALALNEAVQQESGGISLDTMLIDEGFGTLDAETLDTAIHTLVDLQSNGKTIGIISHVGELKERIGNILYVIPNDEKSTTHFNM